VLIFLLTHPGDPSCDQHPDGPQIRRVSALQDALSRNFCTGTSCRHRSNDCRRGWASQSSWSFPPSVNQCLIEISEPIVICCISLYTLSKPDNSLYQYAWSLLEEAIELCRHELQKLRRNARLSSVVMSSRIAPRSENIVELCVWGGFE
jgi:hypothetical protein